MACILLTQRGFANMKTLKKLFDGNRAWVTSKLESNPGFFSALAKQQTPKYLWIGCSDSRVPANEVCGLAPGEMFVHRNVANVVSHTDFNCLAVVQYAVEVLKVTDIIVCGHYGCGGIVATLEGKTRGLIYNWLRHVNDVYQQHREEILALPMNERADRLCELNVARQMTNLCQTTVIEEVWARGQELSVHGWVYRLTDGLIRDLDLYVSSKEELAGLGHHS